MVNVKRIIKNTFVYLSLLSFVISFTSCEKEPEDPVKAYDYNMWVLNEGLWNMNNSSLTAYHTQSKSKSADLFKQKNGRSLGDVANDMIVYGSKVYVVVNQSSTIEVVNAYTGMSIKQIMLKNEKGNGRQPRCVTSYQDHIYVCCFDGTVLKIDTAALSVASIAMAGKNPDGICVSNNKLYVSNSGGLDYPDYGNTLSVFDLSTFKEMKKIKVMTNPGKMIAGFYGEVYLMSLGNYEDIPSRLQRINTYTDTVEQVYDFELSNFDVYGKILYFYHYSFSSAKTMFKQLDTQTGNITQATFVPEDISIQTPYCISVNPYNGNIYIGDALDYQSTGDVYGFDNQGNQTAQFETGICPKKVVFFIDN